MKVLDTLLQMSERKFKSLGLGGRRLRFLLFFHFLLLLLLLLLFFFGGGERGKPVKPDMLGYRTDAGAPVCVCGGGGYSDIFYIHRLD